MTSLIKLRHSQSTRMIRKKWLSSQITSKIWDSTQTPSKTTSFKAKLIYHQRTVLTHLRSVGGAIYLLPQIWRSKDRRDTTHETKRATSHLVNIPLNIEKLAINLRDAKRVIQRKLLIFQANRQHENEVKTNETSHLKNPQENQRASLRLMSYLEIKYKKRPSLQA